MLQQLKWQKKMHFLLMGMKEDNLLVKCAANMT
ncbi:Uncharacterised protein [Serratia fonticola]|nr:Uncharacterised protein [Serratia fonticola]